MSNNLRVGSPPTSFSPLKWDYWYDRWNMAILKPYIQLGHSNDSRLNLWRQFAMNNISLDKYHV